MITFKVKPLSCRKYAFSSGSKRSISGQHALLQLVSTPVGVVATYIIFIEFFLAKLEQILQRILCMYIEKSERQIITIRL